jgi:hypothetical protein
MKFIDKLQYNSQIPNLVNTRSAILGFLHAYGRMDNPVLTAALYGRESTQHESILEGSAPKQPI